MITRRARIQRTARVRRRRAARRGPWRCEKYRRWIASLPCMICGDERTQAAHTVNNGRSSKGPDSSCVPLCAYHHDEMDGRRGMGGEYGKARFEQVYFVILESTAAALFAVWQHKNAPEPECACVRIDVDRDDARDCEPHSVSRNQLPGLVMEDGDVCPI